MTNPRTKKALKEAHFVVKNPQGKFLNLGSKMFDSKFNSMKHIHVDHKKLEHLFRWYCCNRCDDIYNCGHEYTVEKITWVPAFVIYTGDE